MMIYTLLILLLALPNILLFWIFSPPPKRQSSKCYDTCIILGCPARVDGTISRMQKSRMNKAIALYQDHKTKTLLISGAGVRNDFIEAEIMAAYAVKKGVKQTDLLLEMDALNTFDNMRFAKRICDEHNFKDVLVVTSRFHLRRSSYFVRKFFSNYAMDAPDEKEHIKHYFAEYVRMWNSLRYECSINRKKIK